MVSMGSQYLAKKLGRIQERHKKQTQRDPAVEQEMDGQEGEYAGFKFSCAMKKCLTVGLICDGLHIMAEWGNGSSGAH